MTQNALKTFRFVRLALMAGVGFPFILASNAFASWRLRLCLPSQVRQRRPRLRSNASS